MQQPVYLDYAASTPVDPAVVALMTDCLRRPELAGNPAALGHAAGRSAQALVEKARAQVAALINAQPTEIIFCSGATESGGGGGTQVVINTGNDASVDKKK